MPFPDRNSIELIRTESDAGVYCSPQSSEIELSKNGTFSQQIRLISIKLDSNGIDEIPIGAFACCNSLQFLTLSSNQITRLQSGIFKGLYSLMSLNLEDNPIEEIEEDSLSDLMSLRILRMSRTKLRTFPTHIFVTIRKVREFVFTCNENIELDGNFYGELSKLDAESIFLDGNRISNHAWFKTRFSFQTLSMTNNLLTFIPKALPVNLKLIAFDSNKISEVPSNSFENLNFLNES